MIWKIAAKMQEGRTISGEFACEIHRDQRRDREAGRLDDLTNVTGDSNIFGG